MDIEKEFIKMLKQLSVIEEKLDFYLRHTNDHENRLRTLEGKAGKHFDAIITQIIGLIVAAIVGFIMAKFI